MKLEHSYFLNNDKPESIRTEDDKSIWANFKSGDEETFILIYKRYASVLFGYGCRFCLDHELVKDCLQDFFVYLREKRTGLGNTTCIKFYLLKAFKRRILDYSKKIGKEKQKMQDLAFYLSPTEKFYESIYIHQKEVAEEKKLEFLNLARAFKLLNSKEKEAVYYFYYQDLTYEEIADILDFRHVSSARRLIYKSLNRMRKYFNTMDQNN